MNEAADEHVQSSAGHEFPCDNCGASMEWDPVADALTCSYCEHVVVVPRDEGEVVERSLAEADDAARGFGVEVRVAHCDGCGAKVSYDEASTSNVCVYCGEATVLAQEANRNVLRPESLVPIDVDRAKVHENFRKWIRGLWFRPNALKQVAKFEAVGIYVPFWTFDCDVHSDWSADAGYYYYVTVSYTVTVNGKPQVRTRQERRTRWRPAWGQRDDRYDDLLVLASRGLSSDLVEELGDFDTSALVPYKPHYLAGWRAEEYRVDLEGGWELGRESVRDNQRRLCSRDVPGDTQRNLRVKNHISNVRWKHILLPIWSLQYRFKKKTYTVLVHGQTGRVAGTAPLSWIKITVAVLAVVGAVGGVVLVAGR